MAAVSKGSFGAFNLDPPVGWLLIFWWVDRRVWMLMGVVDSAGSPAVPVIPLWSCGSGLEAREWVGVCQVVV
jgi:hypothetical protein